MAVQFNQGIGKLGKTLTLFIGKDDVFDGNFDSTNMPGCINKGSLGIGGEAPRFWGVSGGYPPLTPQNLALTTANPKEPK